MNINTVLFCALSELVSFYPPFSFFFFLFLFLFFFVLSAHTLLSASTMAAENAVLFLIIFIHFSIFRLKYPSLEISSSTHRTTKQPGWFTFMIRYRFHKMNGTDTTKCVTLNDDPKCKCTDDAKKSQLFASLRDSNKNFNFKDWHFFRANRNIIIVMNFANGLFVLNGSPLLSLREILARCAY